MAVQHESSSAKKLPANNSLSEVFRILGTSAERLKQSLEVKTQKELQMESRKNRRLEIKAEQGRHQYALEYSILIWDFKFPKQPTNQPVIRVARGTNTVVSHLNTYPFKYAIPP